MNDTGTLNWPFFVEGIILSLLFKIKFIDTLFKLFLQSRAIANLTSFSII